MIEGVTRVLGENIWSNTFIALTHGRLTSLPGNLSYGEFCMCAIRPAFQAPAAQQIVALASCVWFADSSDDPNLVLVFSCMQLYHSDVAALEGRVLVTSVLETLCL